MRNSSAYKKNGHQSVMIDANSGVLLICLAYCYLGCYDRGIKSSLLHYLFSSGYGTLQTSF